MIQVHLSLSLAVAGGHLVSDISKRMLEVLVCAGSDQLLPELDIREDGPKRPGNLKLWLGTFLPR